MSPLGRYQMNLVIMTAPCPQNSEKLRPGQMLKVVLQCLGSNAKGGMS